jgi:tetratricopeptide (TPR) repeat protein
LAVVAVVAVVHSGCASQSGHIKKSALPAEHIALYRGDANGDSSDLIQSVLFTPGSLDAQRKKVLTHLASHPRDSNAHALAALLATLNADPQARWWHHLQAAADLDNAHGALHLWEAMRENRLVSEVALSLELLEDLMAQHPNPEVRAHAAYLIARWAPRLFELKRAQKATASLMPLREFWVAGVFDNDQGKGFFEKYPPEEGIDPEATMPGLRVPATWRPLSASPINGNLHLASSFTPGNHVLAYAVNRFSMDQDRSVQLRISTSDPVRVWVDGQLVISQEKVDNLALDNLVVPLSLKRGRHTLLIKSASRGGGWRMMVRITDDQGRPMKVGPAEKELPRLPGVEADGKTPALMAPLLNPQNPDSPWARHWRMRDLLRRGFARDALRLAEAHHKEAPDNLIALAHLSGILNSIGEGERSIDHIMKALALSAEKSPYYLMRRARFFERKEQEDKAEADLKKAIALNPDARIARMNLAALFDRRSFHEDNCQILQEVLERWPDSGWAARELTLCLESQGYEEEALDWLKKSVAMEPGLTWGLRKMRSEALKNFRYDEALQWVKKMQTLQPHSAGHHISEGEIHRRRRDDQAAEAAYQRALEIDPDWPRPWDKLARLSYQAGDKDAAVDRWRQALKRDPDNDWLAERLDSLAPEGLGAVEAHMPTEADIDRILAGADQVKHLPGAQLVYLLDHEVTEVNADGSSKRLVTQISQALNQQGRDALIKERIPSRGKVKILQAYSINSDGLRQDAASVRGGTIRFRSLDVGSRVVLQYVHYSPPPAFLPNHFVADWFFEGVRRQHEHSAWVLMMPRGRHLNVRVQGAVESRRLQSATHDVRLFEARHVPPLIPEPFMPPLDDVMRKVTLSTVQGWEEYVAWEKALLADVFHSGPELSALAKKLTEGAASPREKFDRLFHHVAQEIRYQQDYESTIAGVRPHACPVVLERGYGDCKDKAVLLILLAQEVGLDVDFAILRTTNAGEVLKDIPNQQFNHAIVYVPSQEGIAEPFFMDPTTDGLDMGNLRADDQGALSLVLDPVGGKHFFKRIGYQNPDHQVETHSIQIKIASPTEAVVRDSISVRGTTASKMRQVLRNPEVAERLYQGLANTLFAGSTLQSGKSSDHSDIYNPLKMELAIDAQGAITKEDGGHRLRLPSSFSIARSGSLTSRKMPLRFAAPSRVIFDIEAEIPKGTRFVHLPSDFTVNHTCFSVQRKTTAKGRMATIHYEFVRTCTRVEVEDYPAYREKVQEVVARGVDHILFGKK